MTPIQQLKNNLTLFKTLIEDTFKETILNRSQPRYHNDYWNSTEYIKKGVETDCLKLYQVRREEDRPSLAFEFTYLDLPENKHSIRVSIKESNANKGKFHISEPMSVEAFRVALNAANKALAEQKLEKKLDYEDILTITATHVYPAFIKSIRYAPAKSVSKKII